MDLNNGVLTVTADAWKTNSINLWVSSDGSQMWPTVNEITKTFSTNQVSKIVINTGSANDKVFVDSRNWIPYTIANNQWQSSGGTSSAPAPSAPSGISVNNGVLSLVGTPGKWNDFQIWLSGDGNTTWATLNGTTKTLSKWDYSSVQIVKGTTGDSVAFDGRVTPTITVASTGSTGGTGGNTTTPAPTTPGITINNRVLYIVGNAGQYNDIAVWVSNDGSVFWPTMNGSTKQFGAYDFDSIQIVKGTGGDKVVLDGRISKPTSQTVGSSTSTGNTGGSTTPSATPGINIVNGVLQIVGQQWQYNDISVWASNDGSLVWPTLNGTTKQFKSSDFTSVQVVKGSDNDKVALDSRLNKPSSITSPSGTTTNGNTGGNGSTGGNTGGTTTPTPPASNNGWGPNPQAVISLVSSASIIAGQSVSAQALNSSLGAGSQITAKYEWDFGDPNGKYNKLVGYNAAHIYDAPGTYTLTLKVTNENGATSTVTQQVNVSSDNRQAIYVDAYNGNDGNNGSSEYAAVRSIARAQQLLGDNKKILFKRGQTFGTDQGIWAIYSNVTIGAYGSGADPVLKWTGPRKMGISLITDSAQATKNLVVENLQFDVTEPNQDSNPDGVNVHGTNLAIRNCTFLNINSAVNANGSPTGLLVQDNKQPGETGLWAYFVWLQGSDAVIIGNTSANSMRQHNIRAADGFNRALVAYNNFTNLDRRNSGDSMDIAKTTMNIQDGASMYIRGNTLAGGSLRVGPLGGTDGIGTFGNAAIPQRTTNTVVENNTINGTDIQLMHGSENTMVRNNVLKFDDHSAIETEAYDPQYNRQVVNAFIVNNTSINNGPHGNFLWINGQANNIVVDNNLYVAPNMELGGWQTAPIFVKTNTLSMFGQINGNVWATAKSAGWGVDGGVNIVSDGASQTGYKTPSWWNSQSMVGDDAFSGTQIGWDYKPTSGSTASTYAKKFAGVLEDLYGTARPANGVWSAGAVQA